MEAPRHRDRRLWRYGLEEKPRGFLVLPRRRAVQRAFAWLGQARRLAKDYERLPENAVAMIHWAMSRIMLRRPASAPLAKMPRRRVRKAASRSIAKQFLVGAGNVGPTLRNRAQIFRGGKRNGECSLIGCTRIS